MRGSNLLHLETIKNIVIFCIVLTAFYLALSFNYQLQALRFDIDAIKVTPHLYETKTMSPYSVEEAEKWRNFLSMNTIPTGVKQWFAYSDTESARLDQLEADSPVLIEYIRRYKLIPPPSKHLVVREPVKDYSRGQSPVLNEIFRNKKNGYFIECGAYDGEYQSNTLFLERKLQWTGLLIEAEPNNFKAALEKKRNAVLVPACLSLTKKPKLSAFNFGNWVFSKLSTTNQTESTVNVQCVPLYSILLAMNRTTIDLFSLDIEGLEFEVLKTIPFDKVDIKVIVVEFFNIKGGKKPLEDFMTSKGYISIPSKPEERVENAWGYWDFIFVKKGCGYKETRG